MWLSRSQIGGASGLHITKTHLYNFDPLKPHFYIVKLAFTGVYIISLISTQKHRLWVRVRTASPRRFYRVYHNLCFEKEYEEYQHFYLKIFHILVVKFSIYLNRRAFIMIRGPILGPTLFLLFINDLHLFIKFLTHSKYLQTIEYHL